MLPSPDGLLFYPTQSICLYVVRTFHFASRIKFPSFKQHNKKIRTQCSGSPGHPVDFQPNRKLQKPQNCAVLQMHSREKFLVANLALQPTSDLNSTARSIRFKKCFTCLQLSLILRLSFYNIKYFFSCIVLNKTFSNEKHVTEEEKNLRLEVKKGDRQDQHEPLFIPNPAENRNFIFPTAP